MIFDIHSHILPRVDDGAKSVKESCELLRKLKTQKVDAVIATPHLYIPSGTADEVKEKAEKAYAMLKIESERIQGPELFLGYEVGYFNGIASAEDVKKFTLCGTNYILLELPLSSITDKMVDDILEMSYNFKLIPIFAHLERYLRVKGIGKILSMIENGDAFAQITAEKPMGFFKKCPADKLIEGGYVSFIGSDCHSVDKRPPLMDEFYAYATKKYSEGFVKYISENNQNLYNKITKKSQSN